LTVSPETGSVAQLDSPKRASDTASLIARVSVIAYHFLSLAI
jgi:hypothetical protein